ncbi:hypothetical protein M011DRAFT_26060 [Sporormia fimetaria CBS 119925]|uniref:Uncharacterized protein n=1 Tax=Sporormia fimetaria CBS 119925 TaxID=1340428 RepID=A0A6A6VDZ6_9PLEO|nr:hypothetical protein M011DRAFT_26060 [Sporormia fimetaria CBS 119925]
MGFPRTSSMSDDPKHVSFQGLRHSSDRAAWWFTAPLRTTTGSSHLCTHHSQYLLLQTDSACCDSTLLDGTPCSASSILTLVHRLVHSSQPTLCNHLTQPLHTLLSNISTRQCTIHQTHHITPTLLMQVSHILYHTFPNHQNSTTIPRPHNVTLRPCIVTQPQIQKWACQLSSKLSINMDQSRHSILE